ncbi:hypothetical protein AVEN_41021-1 [Araneus ventricosus]|uniref:Uncharacterized protein n=1 Tax=Araneus ventricosus TaxID=182803 RepID=A0A4Y2CID9_ARAVE|nr:hypothetical protein AVEN_41021-1 [Araneus ventricosus]
MISCFRHYQLWFLVPRAGLSRTPKGRVPGSKPDFTEDLLCMRPVSRVLSLVRCGSMEKGCHIRCHSRHLIVVQNHESFPKQPSYCLKIGRKYS